MASSETRTYGSAYAVGSVSSNDTGVEDSLRGAAFCSLASSARFTSLLLNSSSVRLLMLSASPYSAYLAAVDVADDCVTGDEYSGIAE